MVLAESFKKFKNSTENLEPVPGESNQYIAYVAYPIDLFDCASINPICIYFP